MKIEEQVITLKQAQLLFERGVNAPSAWSWVHNGAGWQLMPEGYFTVEPYIGESYPAYSVAEIMKALGMRIFSNIEKCGYSYPNYGNCSRYFHGRTYGHSAGELLIYLLGDDLITPIEINERLK